MKWQKEKNGQQSTTVAENKNQSSHRTCCYVKVTVHTHTGLGLPYW